ncbi:hypothetical protein QQF64_006736 [Cirrhinus molitorella]|uniref:Uncharacterized protein n=1 Tax=Cirrhinus molitorella TaxID=172907 RepID=A0ABR3M8P9_9TELE
MELRTTSVELKVQESTKMVQTGIESIERLTAVSAAVAGQTESLGTASLAVTGQAESSGVGATSQRATKEDATTLGFCNRWDSAVVAATSGGAGAGSGVYPWIETSSGVNL